MKNMLLSQGTKIPAYAISTALTVAKLGALSAMFGLWNRLPFRWADDELPEDIKSKPHMTFGKVGGEVLYLDRLGMLEDLGEWVGLNNLFTDIPEIMNGQLTAGQYLKKVIQAPISKTMNMLNPMIKIPFELATERNLYPDVFNAGVIHDKGKHVASAVGLMWPYKALVGEPRSDWNELLHVLVKSVEPDEASYFQTLNKVREFQNRVLGRSFSGFANSERGEVLRRMKQAMRFNDKQAVRRYIKEYRKLDGTDTGLKASMKAMEPLHGLNKEEQQKFLKWCTPEDRAILRKAQRYYKQLVRGYL